MLVLCAPLLGSLGHIGCNGIVCYQVKFLRLFLHKMRRGGRVAEGAPLLREYTLTRYRGFESLPLRHLLLATKSPQKNLPFIAFDCPFVVALFLY